MHKYVQQKTTSGDHTDSIWLQESIIIRLIMSTDICKAGSRLSLCSSTSPEIPFFEEVISDFCEHCWIHYVTDMYLKRHDKLHHSCWCLQYRLNQVVFEEVTKWCYVWDLLVACWIWSKVNLAKCCLHPSIIMLFYPKLVVFMSTACI